MCNSCVHLPQQFPQGHPISLYDLGGHYFAGKGVEQSFEKAAKKEWSKMAEKELSYPTECAREASLPSVILHLRHVRNLIPSQPISGSIGCACKKRVVQEADPVV